MCEAGTTQQSRRDFTKRNVSIGTGSDQTQPFAAAHDIAVAQNRGLSDRATISV